MAKAKTPGPKLYEGLFLLNQASVASDFAGTVEYVRQLFTRANAELIVLRKWDERRLAYEIEGQKRGTYLLAYFKAEGDSIAHIERDVNLSETVVRMLVLKADHIGEAEIESAKKDADLSLEVKLREDDNRSRPAEEEPQATDESDTDDEDVETVVSGEEA